MAKLDDIAKVLTVTPRRVQQLASDGIIPRPDSRGDYDMFRCVTGYITYLKRLAQGQGDLSLTDARTRLAKEQADRLEMDNRRMRGELAVVQDVVDALSDTVIAIRQKILGMGDRLSPRIVALNGIGEAKAIVDEYSRALLTELSEVKVPITVGDQATDRKQLPDSVPAPSEVDGERVGGPEP